MLKFDLCLKSIFQSVYVENSRSIEENLTIYDTSGLIATGIKDRQSLMWTHTLHVRGCTRARTSGSDLDHWRRAISGPGSMHHSLVNTDLQQSFYFNYSQCNRQHRGYNLCSNISKLYSSSVSAGECKRRGADNWPLSQLPLLGQLLIFRPICLQAESLQCDLKHQHQLTRRSHVTIKLLLYTVKDDRWVGNNQQTRTERVFDSRC